MKAVVNTKWLRKVVASFPKATKLYLAPVSLRAKGEEIEFVILHNNGIMKMRVPAQVQEEGMALPDPVQFRTLVKNAQDIETLTLERKGESGRLKISFQTGDGKNVEYAIYCYPDEQEPEVALDGVEYDTTIAELRAECAEQVWKTMKELKPFRGDALSGYSDFFIDLDENGNPIMFATSGAYMVLKRLPNEVAEAKLPLRLPGDLTDMLPQVFEDIALFGKRDEDHMRMYLVGLTTELSFTVSSRTLPLPDWLKHDLSRLDTFPGFTYLDRNTLLKALQIAKVPQRSRLAVDRVARFSLRSDYSLLEIFSRDGDYVPEASLTLPPSDTAASKIALFNCDLLHSLISALPLVEFRFADATFAPNAAVLYARDPSKSVVAVLASLDPQYFEELFNENTEVSQHVSA